MNDAIVPEMLEELLGQVQIVQVDDGTTFYYTERLLYAKLNGTIIYAKLPSESSITSVGVFGPAVYFVSERKIYKAVADNDEITVSFSRQLLEGETVNALGLCSPTQQGTTHVYKINDGPDSNALPVPNISAIALGDFELDREGKLVYIRRNEETSDGVIHNINETTVGLTLPLAASCQKWRSYAQELFPFLLFISDGSNLFTVDINARYIFPTLHFSDPSDFEIVSVIDEQMILVKTEPNLGRRFRCRASFPDGFLSAETRLSARLSNANTEEEDLAAALKASLEAHREEEKLKKIPEKPQGPPKTLLDERIMELDSQLGNTKRKQNAQAKLEQYHDSTIQKLQKEIDRMHGEPAAKKRNDKGIDAENSTCEDEEQKKWKEETSATINQLLDQNMELTQELEKLQMAKKENSNSMTIIEQHELQEQLTRIKHELEGKNWQLSEDVENVENENGELEAKNEELTREIEQLTEQADKKEQEMKAVIDDTQWKIDLPVEIDHLKQLSKQMETTSVELFDENKELKRRIALMKKQNEKLSKALPQRDSGDSSADESYEMIS